MGSLEQLLLPLWGQRRAGEWVGVKDFVLYAYTPLVLSLFRASV